MDRPHRSPLSLIKATRKLSNLPVGLRLGLSFGAILVITALIAAMGMWRISSLQMASERVATQEIEQQTLVEDWASDIRLNWVRTEAFLKAIDRDYMEKFTADTHATATSMESKVKRIEGLVQDDQARALLTAIAAARAAYSDKLNEIRELHRGGEPNVPAMVDTDLRPLADRYLGALDDLRKTMATQLADSQRDTSTLARGSQMLLGVGTLVAVALGALLAWTVTRSIVRPVQLGRQAAERIANGDLTCPIACDSRDETGQLLQALATMQSRLAAIVGNVRNSAEGVATASVEIATGNNDLSARTEQQASALEETAASMEELGSTVRQNADNARQARELASSSNAVAEQGGEVGLIVHCPHGPDDGCACRKPKPGMLQQIAAHYGVSLAGLWFVGDSRGDLDAALAVDCQPVLVKTGKGERTLAKALPAGTLIFEDLAAVAAQLLH